MSPTAKLASSLPVENVQALATKELKDIPDRYIRPELQFDYVSVEESRDVPVIDLTKLLDEQFSGDEMARFHAACEEWGFFQLISHGMPEDLIEKLRVDVQEFFKLPLEEKKAYSQLANSFEGYGQAFVISEEQNLDWADMFFINTLPTEDRNMRFWPNYFREALDKYSVDLKRIAVVLIGLMAKNLGVEPEQLTNIVENGRQLTRINYYPPCPQADKVLGGPPHSDATCLTLLLQVNEVDGLQIRKNGNWVPVKPISGAFVVNVGDSVEILSNGKYKSIEHRAIVNPQKERLSIAAFHSPAYKCMIGPLPSLINGNRELYKAISHEDYLRHHFSSKVIGKNTLDLVKLDRERCTGEALVLE